MSTQVVRIEGYSHGSLTCIGNECDRAEGIEHRNSDINPERTPLNISYKDVSDGNGFYAEHAQILANLNASYTQKKNSIAFEGMIITSDLEFFKSLGYNPDKKEKLPKKVKKYFDDCYKWALRQIGYDGKDTNIISAKVHLDEKTPHMHIYYLPVTDKWQEKVYAKDENGITKRTAKGTPIQAKDENGKTIYKQVQNKEKPKLARTEFWSVRGGKASYRRLQDSFQAEVGKAYGLERGEVGSNREHETKYQHKEKELDGRILKKEKIQKRHFFRYPLGQGIGIVDDDTGKVMSQNETIKYVTSLEATGKEANECKKNLKAVKKENKALKAKSKADDEKIKELSTGYYSREQMKKTEKDVKNNASEAEIRRYLSTIQFSDGTTGVEDFSRWRKEQNQSKNKSEQEL